jgi:hypothetical protein
VPAEALWDASTNRATFAFSGLLPDGEYRALLSADAVTHAEGAAVEGVEPLDFFVLRGDADRDRTVEIDDLGVLASNWQQSPRTFSDGDFNYDDVVDITDLGILATNWQQTLAPPPPRPAVFAFSAATLAKRRATNRMVDEVI